jgi:hypothetical protein
MSDPEIPIESVRQVRHRYQDELMAKANVVGVGVGFRQRGGESTREPAVVVMVRKKVPASSLAPEDVIPAFLEGVPVDVQEVGDLRAL